MASQGNQLDKQNQPSSSEPEAAGEATIKPEDFADSQSSEGAASAGWNPDRYKTWVKLYMLSTGDDQGNSVEMIGNINVSGNNVNINKVYAKWANYRADNGGLGTFITYAENTKSGIPPAFGVNLYEDDNTGKQWIFQNFYIDPTNPAHVQYFNGQVFRWTWHNTVETAFKATVEWQCIKNP
ncbi:hypothetical protein H2198_010408 [Neophaeococcomyces mojaviensis]|uniref:Uncharacterized protein n=1 Tax=Neophaeococcomyces mojaviensis TaxID=3383035 RepID=A0ACC2ZRW8_9EURO|nr:hypothetical protein H2198_010408 [Knufia sp. JES_112]